VTSGKARLLGAWRIGRWRSYPRVSDSTPRYRPTDDARTYARCATTSIVARLAEESHAILPFAFMHGDMRLQGFPRFQERESGGCCGLIGLLEFLLLARLQSPGNVHIYPCVGPQATMKDLMHPTHLGLHRRGGSRHVDIEACRMKLFHSKKYLGYCRAKSIVMMIR